MLYNRYNWFTTELKKWIIWHHFTNVCSAEFKPPRSGIKWYDWIKVNIAELISAQVEVQISPTEPEEVKSTSPGARKMEKVCWLFCCCCDFCCILYNLYLIYLLVFLYVWLQLMLVELFEVNTYFRAWILDIHMPMFEQTYTTSLSFPSSRLIRKTVFNAISVLVWVFIGRLT